MYVGCEKGVNGWNCGPNVSATQSVSVLTEMAVREENFSFSWLIGNLLTFDGNEGSAIASYGN
jgi:hypothetical protein